MPQRNTFLHIIRAKDAKSNGLKKYFTGKECKNGHVSLRYTHGYTCVECNKEYLDNNRQYVNEKRKIKYRENEDYAEAKREMARNYYANNTEKCCASSKSWAEKNKDRKKQKDKDYYEENKELILEKSRQYRIENSETIKERKKKYYEENIDEIRRKRRDITEEERIARNEAKREWRNKNIEYYREQAREKNRIQYKNDPEMKMLCAMRGMLRRLYIEKAGKRTKEILGYDKKDLVEHIESQFVNGMTWDNYGEWHIDHIRPMKSFINDGITDPKIINALENLQPLWASENISKGAKYKGS